MKKNLLFIGGLLATVSSIAQISFQHIGSYETNQFDASATEIAVYDEVRQQVYSTNGATNSVDIVDISNPSSPSLANSFDLSTYGTGINSVAYYNGYIACALEGSTPQAAGAVAFFDVTNNTYVTSVTVGAMPDMITFSPDGSKVLTADEGEPNDDYSNDPLGTVSIIDVSGGVANVQQSDVITLDFTAYNGQTLDPSIRIFGPGATVATDLEPEYIAISEDGNTAYVVMQENNALAIIDLTNNSITTLKGLGFKDHSVAGNGLDDSDDDGIEINTRANVFGMYQPDAMKTYTVNGSTYIVTANEGDARDYDAIEEEERVKDLTLDPTAFPQSYIQDDTAMGRLTVTNTLGDTDNDGDFDELYVFGTRSFSIWDDNGTLVYDSGDDFETYTSMGSWSNYFNSNNDDNNSFQSRSDNKGPEPEAICIIETNAETYALIGLERMGGFMVYDITDPQNVSYVDYINNRDFTVAATTSAAGDLGPENIIFVPKSESPNNKDMVIVSNEVSGTISMFEVSGIDTGSSGAGLLDEAMFDFTVYPNPVEDHLNISVKGNYALYNISGQKVQQVYNQQFIDVSELPSGVYFLNNSKGQTKKIIVE